MAVCCCSLPPDRSPAALFAFRQGRQHRQQLCWHNPQFHIFPLSSLCSLFSACQPCQDSFRHRSPYQWVYGNRRSHAAVWIHRFRLLWIEIYCVSSHAGASHLMIYPVNLLFQLNHFDFRLSSMIMHHRHPGTFWCCITCKNSASDVAVMQQSKSGTWTWTKSFANKTIKGNIYVIMCLSVFLLLEMSISKWRAKWLFHVSFDLDFNFWNAQ